MVFELWGIIEACHTLCPDLLEWLANGERVYKGRGRGPHHHDIDEKLWRVKSGT